MNQLHRLYCRSALWKRLLQERILPWALQSLDLGDELLEIGPGPGLATDIVRHRTKHLITLEIDSKLAERLERRLAGSNVTVIKGDATAMPFEDGNFSAVVSFTMLHHVPSPELQNQLFAEVFRVLQPGGCFAGTDSIWSPGFQLVHVFDTLVAIDPATLTGRLQAVGFKNVEVESKRRTFRFAAQHP